MRTKILTGGLLAVLLTFATACNQKGEKTTSTTPAVDADKVKTEIQAIENHFAETFNSRNVNILTYYADDATSFFDDKKPVSGKAAIQQFIAEELVAFPKGATISFETKEVHISSDGNQVVEIGRFTTKDSTNKIRNNGNYMSVFEKRDGKYLCIRDMSSNEPVMP